MGLPGQNPADFENISGSRMREMAKNNEALPKGFMSEAGWKVLGDYYRNLWVWSPKIIQCCITIS
jgi:hypothetical protein